MNFNSFSKLGVDFFSINIPKKEVLQKDIKPTLGLLQQLISNSNTIIKYKGRVDIGFDGYDNNTRELWEIEEIRNFVRELDNQFPFWLYFLSVNGGGLYCIIQCFLSPFLTEEAKKVYHPKQLSSYLLNRGFPAMNQLCEVSNCSEKEIEEITDKVMRYFYA